MPAGPRGGDGSIMGLCVRPGSAAAVRDVGRGVTPPVPSVERHSRATFAGVTTKDSARDPEHLGKSATPSPAPLGHGKALDRPMVRGGVVVGAE